MTTAATVTGVILALFGIVGVVYGELCKKAEVGEYDSWRDSAWSGMIAQTTETLAKALEPGLHRLRERPELIQFDKNLRTVRRTTDILKEVGIPEILREYEEQYSKLFVKYSDIKVMHDKVMASVRQHRNLARGAWLGLLVAGATMIALEFFNVPPWVQVALLFIIVLLAVVAYRKLSRHDRMIDGYRDKCSELWPKLGMPI